MLTEKRIATMTILIENKESVHRMNTLISDFSGIILARQGLVVQHHNLNIISLILEGDSDSVSALSGQIGRLRGMKVKTVFVK